MQQRFQLPLILVWNVVCWLLNNWKPNFSLILSINILVFYSCTTSMVLANKLIKIHQTLSKNSKKSIWLTPIWRESQHKFEAMMFIYSQPFDQPFDARNNRSSVKHLHWPSLRQFAREKSSFRNLGSDLTELKGFHPVEKFPCSM